MKLIKFNGAKDYNKLSHLPFNRTFKVREDLTNKMNQYGFTVPMILIKTKLINGREEIYIADGQNRAVTAAFLNITFFGILIDKQFKTIEDIVEFVSSLNSAHKPWTALNYAESYAFLGKEDYKKLLELTQQSPYSVETMSNLLTGVRSRGRVVDKIKNGTFQIKQLPETLKTLDLSASLSKYEKLTARMVVALHYISSLSRFDESKFTATYKQKAKEVKELKLDDYSDLFQSWIN